MPRRHPFAAAAGRLCNGTLWQYNRAPGANSALDAGEWIQTNASEIADVAGDNVNSIWVTGKNGTVWQMINRPVAGRSSSFETVSQPAGFRSIAVGRGKVFAVRTDGTLWRYK